MNSIKSRICNASCILGILSGILIVISMNLPAIDFSHFHQEVQLEYNLFKICENVRLISPIWTGVPAGIIIGAILMIALSFVKIPLLKLIPSFIIISMVVIMLVDLENIVSWAQEVVALAKLDYQVLVNNTEVFKSFKSGIYLLAVGIVTGFISCFMPTSKA